MPTFPATAREHRRRLDAALATYAKATAVPIARLTNALAEGFDPDDSAEALADLQTITRNVDLLRSTAQGIADALVLIAERRPGW